MKKASVWLVAVPVGAVALYLVSRSKDATAVGPTTGPTLTQAGQAPSVGTLAGAPQINAATPSPTIEGVPTFAF